MAAVSGTPPTDIVRVELASATNWNEYTFPSWVRTVVVRNETGAAMYYGKGLGTGAVGAFPPADTVSFGTLEDDEEVPLYIGDVRGFTLSLASNAASTPPVVLRLLSV